MKTATSSTSFQNILRHLAKQSPEEKLRIGFNLWQFAKDLQDKRVNYEYGRKRIHSSRTTA